IVPRQRRELQAEELRRDAFSLLEVEFARRVIAVKEALHQLSDRTALQAVGIVPVGSGAGGPLDRIDEPLVVSVHAKRAVRGPFDNRSRNRQGREQAEVVHRPKVWDRIQSVRPSEPLNSGRPGCCSLHPRIYGEKGLIPRIFFLLAAMLTEVRKAPLTADGHANRLSRGNPIGGIRPAAPRAARHGDRSDSLRTRPLSPPSGQLSPSASGKAIASLRPPSR